MSIGLYMDQNVPAGIASGFRQRGVDVLTAREDGTSRFQDDELLARATHLRRVLFTQDEDLLVLAGKWQEEGRMFSGVAYAHQLRVSIGEAVLSLELIAGVLDPEDAENEVYYFPL